MFECDAKLSADGTLFLLHDATLERTTSGRGIAGEQPWAALSLLDAGLWHSRAFAGEPVPSLAAIASYAQRNGFALNIEIKPTPGSEVATGTAVAQFAAKAWANEATKPLLSSFEVAALEAAFAADPILPLGLLLKSLPADWLALAHRLQCAAVIAQHALLDSNVIAAIHGAGMKAGCYTVNDEWEAARLKAAGIDFIITDRVDLFSPA
jgi:glycerophosphoryl diester phosphodiesterase